MLTFTTAPRQRKQHVAVWHGLSPIDWVRPPSGAALPFPFSAAHKTYGYLARNLIYHLFSALRLRPDEGVLVPDYHHGNEILAMRAAGASLHFYPVRKTLEMDLDAVAALCRKVKPRVLFAIHYLGWPQPLPELLALCRQHDMLLVEDCALALLSQAGGRPLGSTGDYGIFCLYKTLALPNGALLVQNGAPLEALARLPLQPPSFLSTTARNVNLTLEWLRTKHPAAGQAGFALKRLTGQALSAIRVARAPVGDSSFDTGRAHLDMSPSCRRLLTRFDYATIVQKRRENYQRLAGSLRGEAVLLKPELAPGICPLFCPLLVSDKHEAAMALLRRGVETMEFWNEGDPAGDGATAADARFLRKHVLELPIHQDLTAEQIDYVATQVRGLPLRLLAVDMEEARPAARNAGEAA